jgi:hypothetical protein
MPRPKPKKLLLALLGLFLLAAAGLSLYWATQRKLALEVIEAEIPAGLRIDWQGPGFTPTSSMPSSTVARYSPFTRPHRVAIGFRIVDPKKLGAALKHFGGIQTLSAGSGDPEEIQELLESLGNQRSMTDLHLFHVPLDDRVLPVLARLRSLSQLSMVPSELSGENFPLLPELRVIDLSYSPISNSGLARLMSCPNLERLSVRGEHVTRQGIFEAVKTASPTVRSLRVYGTKFLLEELDQIEAEVRKLSPALDFAVRR